MCNMSPVYFKLKYFANPVHFQIYPENRLHDIMFKRGVGHLIKVVFIG